jgi:phenylacetate-CoA ligase
MIFIPVVRSIQHFRKGQRPNERDLACIIDYLKKRQLSGKQFAFQRMEKLSTVLFKREKVKAFLVKLQLHKLRNTLNYAYQNVPIYRELFDQHHIKPEALKSLQDITRFPFTFKEQVDQRTADFFSREKGLSITVLTQTSGTTGNPTELYLTDHEYEYYTSITAIAGLLSGMYGPGEITAIFLPLGRSASANTTTCSAHKAGTLVLNLGGGGTLEQHVTEIFKTHQLPGKVSKVTSFHTTPAHLWALTHKALQMSMDFKKSKVKYIVMGGAIADKELKHLVKETWNAQLINIYGLVETAVAGGIECQYGKMHLSDFGAYSEIIHPETKLPVAPGEEGILVTTPFYPDRILMPMIRYWTGDLVRLSVEQNCSCGQATLVLDEIIGRYDHMIILSSLNIYPQEIGNSLLKIEELALPPRFTVRTEKGPDAQIVILDIEYRKDLGLTVFESLKNRIRSEISFSQFWQIKLGSIRLEINLHPFGTLENTFPYKHVIL